MDNIMEILDKLQFFGGQRAGRELWADKPTDVQDADIESFNENIEAIRDYIQQLEEDIKNIREDNPVGAVALIGRELLARLQSQIPRWISVEERLPEVDKRYDGYEYSAELLVYDGLRRRSAYYCHTSGVWYDSRYEDDTFEVTHYMPLPEPPKEATP